MKRTDHDTATANPASDARTNVKSNGQTAVRGEAVPADLSAILASFLIGFFLHDFGVGGVFGLIAASMLVVMLAIGIFGPRTRGLALEAISH